MLDMGERESKIGVVVVLGKMCLWDHLASSYCKVDGDLCGKMSLVTCFILSRALRGVWVIAPCELQFFYDTIKWPEWKLTMDAKLATLEANNTWTIVYLRVTTYSDGILHETNFVKFDPRLKKIGKAIVSILLYELRSTPRFCLDCVFMNLPHFSHSLQGFDSSQILNFELMSRKEKLS
ncbi:hypothetical protein VNO77_24613 [Canavalia gladiata]|uniref:Uncharacterized protein n=1 Tax=Canavalia gladiata TaxID=3824 RepID=A0AAN9L766_CANGL